MTQQDNKSALSTDTAAIQSALATVCRSGVVKELPGVTSTARVEAYRGLIFNNFEDTLARAYPITRSLLRSKRWGICVEQFVATHTSSSPQLWRMPGEFAEFIIERQFGEEWKVWYLDDLVRFEWSEIEVFMMPDLNAATYGSSKITPLTEDASGKLAINLEFVTLELDYPVYEKVVGQFKNRRGRYLIVCFRHPKSLQPTFLELTSFSLAILQLLQHKPCTLTEALETVCAKQKISLTADLLSTGQQLMAKLYNEGLFLGALQ